MAFQKRQKPELMEKDPLFWEYSTSENACKPPTATSTQLN